MKIAKDIPKNIQHTMDDLAFARRYNNVTGANLSHKEISEFGYMESLELDLAMGMLTGN